MVHYTAHGRGLATPDGSFPLRQHETCLAQVVVSLVPKSRSSAMAPEPGVLPVADGVWRISTPMPFRPRIVHAYLVRIPGDRWMLVDGGVNSDAAWLALDSGVRAVTGTWDGMVLHLVTHMHLDHLGLSERIRRVSAAPLAMGQLDAERAAHAAADPEEEAGYREELLRIHGVPDDQVRLVQSGRAGADPLGSFVIPDYPLAAGVASLPQVDGWLVVWTPGHTAGHVSLFREADGLLIAGDALLPGITPTIGVNRQREDPVGDYLATLVRLEDLAPTLALAGHGDPMETPLVRIAQLRNATREETDRVAGLLSREPATAWAITCARYSGRDLPPSTLMLAFRETLAHLQHLVGLGRAVRVGEGGTAHFQLA